MKFRLTAIALVLCLLILPMNVTAIVVGEDTAPAGYIEYLQYDIDTRETTTQYAPINNSTETWSLFTEREVAQMEAAVDAAQNEIGTNDIIGDPGNNGMGDLYLSDPDTSATSRAIVYLRSYYDKDGDGDYDIITRGTGFLVSHNVLVTAAHCVVPEDGHTLIEARAYYDVHGSSLSGAQYVTLDKLWWSYGYTAEDLTVSNRYDYCVATLDESIDRAYYFNCANSTTIQNMNAFVSGYPKDNEEDPNSEDYFYCAYYQYRSSGSISYVDEYHLRYNNDTAGGMSGAPVFNAYATAYGVHRAGYGSYNQAVRFHIQLYTTICNTIERYS